MLCASSAAALVFYLPGVCTHTLTPRENRVRNIFKNTEKTQYLMNTLYKNNIQEGTFVAFVAALGDKQRDPIPLLPFLYRTFTCFLHAKTHIKHNKKTYSEILAVIFQNALH